MLNVALCDRDIRKLIEKKILEVGSSSNIESCLQPASYDLTVGERMWRMDNSFLPAQGQSVLDIVHKFNCREIDLRQGAVLQRGEVYLIEMLESVNLDDTLSLKANTKSSSGRVNVQTRLVVDGNPAYDSVIGPFQGKMYSQVVSASFFPIIATGISLNQVGFYRGRSRVPDDELYTRSLEHPILYDSKGDPISGKNNLMEGLVLSLDLESEIVGFKARTWHKELDLRKINYYKPEDFWQIITKPNVGSLRLDVGGFYILSTKEGMTLPPVYAGELSFVDPRASRSPVHEAGFIDPGFGFYTKGGNNLTLEINPSREDRYVSGQRVGVIAIERMSGIPDKVYGSNGLGSNYGLQRGPRLSKHFRT